MTDDGGVPITEARDVLGQLVGRVQYGHERIVLTRHGRPAAALVPMDDHEALERLEDEIDGWPTRWPRCASRGVSRGRN